MSVRDRPLAPARAPATTLAAGPARVATPRTPSDEEIVAALAAGAEWAAEHLYDRTHAHVERTLRRVLRFQHGEHADLVQASFERMLRFLSQRSLTGACNLPGWASAVAANVALDHLRKRARERRLFDGEGTALDAVHAGDAGPERAAAARAAASRVQQLLARMKPKHAETVVLHDVLGHDLAEIAAMTGASVSATQSRLVRGRKDLLRRAKERS